jgi:predicted PurR-regulated permease PerM
MKYSYARLRVFSYGIISFIGMVYIMKLGSFILIPLVWASFFTFALMPLTAWLENKRIPRLMAITLSLGLVAIIALLIVYLFAVQLSSLLHDAPLMGDKLQIFMKELEETIHEKFGFSQVFRNLSLSVTSYISDKNFDSVVRFTTTTATSLTLLPVFIFIFLYYQDFFREFIRRIGPDGNPDFVGWMAEAIILVRKYLAGMLLVTIIVSVLASIMFYLIGIKYYVLFGLFTAVCNLIPYVGVILGSIITIFYVLITTDQIWYPLITLFLLWLLQAVENNLITPVVVGAKIKLNPLAVILAIVVGGGVWGVSGMILFIPMLGILKILMDKTTSLKPYGYLLGDEIPVIHRKENLFIYLLHRLKKSAGSASVS